MDRLLAQLHSEIAELETELSRLADHPNVSPEKYRDLREQLRVLKERALPQ